jgi:hypothetical protein
MNTGQHTLQPGTKQSTRAKGCLCVFALLGILVNSGLFLLLLGFSTGEYGPLELMDLVQLGWLVLSTMFLVLILVGLAKSWRKWSLVVLLFLGFSWLWGPPVYAIYTTLQAPEPLRATLPLPPQNDLNQHEISYEETRDIFGVTSSPLITFTTPEPMAQVVAFYEQTLPVQEWTVKRSFSREGFVDLDVRKDSYVLSISVEQRDKQTFVVIGPKQK